MKFEISYNLSKGDLVLRKIIILNGNCQKKKKKKKERKKERKKRKVKIQKYSTKNKNLQ